MLYTVTWDVSTPTELPTDGAGLYALQTDDRTVVCIDSFGQTVGTAKAAFKVSNIAFEDGVLVLQGENQQAKYLPTGEITPEGEPPSGGGDVGAHRRGDCRCSPAGTKGG